ncbi:MAG: hypothetical protein WBY71_02010, partial [Nitrososphaeraceae archaeon]
RACKLVAMNGSSKTQNIINDSSSSISQIFKGVTHFLLQPLVHGPHDTVSYSSIVRLRESEKAAITIPAIPAPILTIAIIYDLSAAFFTS